MTEVVLPRGVTVLCEGKPFIQQTDKGENRRELLPTAVVITAEPYRPGGITDNGIRHAYLGRAPRGAKTHHRVLLAGIAVVDKATREVVTNADERHPLLSAGFREVKAVDPLALLRQLYIVQKLQPDAEERPDDGFWHQPNRNILVAQFEMAGRIARGARRPWFLAYPISGVSAREAYDQVVAGVGATEINRTLTTSPGSTRLDKAIQTLQANNIPVDIASLGKALRARLIVSTPTIEGIL